MPNVCPVCGHHVRIAPSQPAGDAPCPRCGHLLWFEATPNAPVTRLKLHVPARSNSAPLPQHRRKREANTRPGAFTLVDFKKTMGQMKKLGPLKQIMNLIPGMGNVADMTHEADLEQDLKQIEGIIDAMTLVERENPAVIDTARRRRIAAGSGIETADVNKLLKEFSVMSAMLERMASMTKPGG
jgi:signal recognition particle GTPase